MGKDSLLLQMIPQWDAHHKWRADSAVEGNPSVCGGLALVHDVAPQCRWLHRWLIFIPQALKSHSCGKRVFLADSFHITICTTISTHPISCEPKSHMRDYNTHNMTSEQNWLFQIGWLFSKSSDDDVSGLIFPNMWKCNPHRCKDHDFFLNVQIQHGFHFSWERSRRMYFKWICNSNMSKELRLGPLSAETNSGRESVLVNSNSCISLVMTSQGVFLTRWR